LGKVSERSLVSVWCGWLVWRMWLYICVKRYKFINDISNTIWI